ncbi:MAG: hypothetical protein FJ276_18730, partial [Planctomycetes bacterium]|nr:hypothetical protein [Planctomycetota bacterium]
AQNFTIAVTDVNESGIGPISDTDAAADTVLENSANGTTVGLTAFADDPDGTDTVSYSLDDNAGGRFAIHATTGVVTVNGALDHETATSHSVTIRATSSDGSFSTQNFTIAVTDLNDNAPVLVHNDLILMEGETVTLANGNLQSVDPDGTPVVLTYTVGGVTGGRFERAASPGVGITLFTQPEVDLGQIVFVHDGGELAPTYAVTVSDGVFLVGPQAATISFTNVNDAPHAANVSFEVGTSTLLGSLLSWVEDADGDPLAFLLLTAPTAGTLQLAPDGSFSYAPANTMAGVCSFAYQVSDGQATSNVAVVSITVLLDGVLPPPGDGHIRSDRDSSSSDDSSEAPPPNSPLDVDGGMLVPEAVPHGPAKTSTSTDTTDRPSDPGLTSDANAEPEFQQPLAVLARGDAESGVMRPQPSATVDADNSTAVQDEARVGDGAAGETGVFVHLGQSGALWRELDEFHQTVESGTDVSAIAIGSVGTIASGLTVGYVLWVLRSGLVLSSILASLPAWTMFDPLVVVSASGRMDEEQDEESLEDLVENQAAWAAERQRENRITEPLP